MKSRLLYPVIFLLLLHCASANAEEDKRQVVELPEMMQQHMLANMRDHMMVINEIINYLAQDKLDVAADIAEKRLGMSSLASHGAQHMGQFMPQAMRATGMQMHRAASRFALRAEEGEKKLALAALGEVTQACVSCHSSYRIH